MPVLEPGDPVGWALFVRTKLKWKRVNVQISLRHPVRHLDCGNGQMRAWVHAAHAAVERKSGQLLDVLNADPLSGHKETNASTPITN